MFLRSIFSALQPVPIPKASNFFGMDLYSKNKVFIGVFFMSTPDDAKVKNELSQLIYDGSRICGYKGNYDTGQQYCIFNKDFNKFQSSAEYILFKRLGKEDIHYKNFMKIYNVPTTTDHEDEYNKRRRVIYEQVGVLESALGAIEKGFTGDLFYERELVVFSNMLDQAYEFLKNQNTYLAAGVYGRIVLETTIREFAKLKLGENYNPEMRFDQLIIELRNGFINQTFENSLRNNYKIGSEAAHNSDEFREYSKRNLKDFLTFIRDNVLILK